MSGSTTWLGREVDALATQWLAQLADWQPFAVHRGDRGVCVTCVRYAEQLQLDETPHAMLHPIASAIDDRLTGCFLGIAEERYEHLVDVGWAFAVEDGMVRVAPPGTAIFLDPEEVAAETGDLRFELILLYTELQAIAIAAVLQRHPAIARAVRAAVEPRMQELTDQLLREVCGT